MLLLAILQIPEHNFSKFFFLLLDVDLKKMFDLEFKIEIAYVIIWLKDLIDMWKVIMSAIIVCELNIQVQKSQHLRIDFLWQIEAHGLAFLALVQCYYNIARFIQNFRINILQ